LFNGKIDKQIAEMPNKNCFARLDTLSSKPKKPYKNSLEIILDLSKTPRTSQYFTKEMKIIIREYLDFDLDSKTNCNIEFRCFVHNKQLRGISSEGEIKDLNEVIENINKITFYTDYDSYCADFTYYNNKLILIEINTPVWLFGCSSLFSLDEPFDLEVLTGKYIPEIISYPIIYTNK
jgi:hypothetical protein